MLSPYRKVFNIVKSIIPKISETEIIALKSGGVSIDRELFNGKVDYNKLYKPILIKLKQLIYYEVLVAKIFIQMKTFIN